MSSHEHVFNNLTVDKVCYDLRTELPLYKRYTIAIRFTLTHEPLAAALRTATLQLCEVTQGVPLSLPEGKFCLHCYQDQLAKFMIR